MLLEAFHKQSTLSGAARRGLLLDEPLERLPIALTCNNRWRRRRKCRSVLSDAKRSGKRTEERMTAQSLSFVFVDYFPAVIGWEDGISLGWQRCVTAISFPPPLLI